MSELGGDETAGYGEDAAFEQQHKKTHSLEKREENIRVHRHYIEDSTTTAFPSDFQGTSGDSNPRAGSAESDSVCVAPRHPAKKSRRG